MTASTAPIEGYECLPTALTVSDRHWVTQLPGYGLNEMGPHFTLPGSDTEGVRLGGANREGAVTGSM